MENSISLFPTSQLVFSYSDFPFSTGPSLIRFDYLLRRGIALELIGIPPSPMCNLIAISRIKSQLDHDELVCNARFVFY